MNIRHSPRAVMWSLVLLLGSLATAASAQEAVIKGDGGKIRLIFSPTGTNSFIPFTIKKFGLDKKHGFELEAIPQVLTQAAIVAMQGGAADVNTFDWNDISRLRNAGFKVIGVAPFLAWGADFYIAPVGSPVKSVADIKGRRIGTTSRTTLNWIILRAVAEKVYKFNIERDATVQEGAVTLLRGIAEQGELDVVATFNSMAPAAVLSGKFRVVAKISDLIAQVGLPQVPFLLYSFTEDYVQKKPQNVRAFIAAYQDAVRILRTDDQTWLERGAELGMEVPALVAFRTEARKDVWLKFEPGTEADIRKTFALLLETAGSGVLGLSQLADGFMTAAFQ